MAARVLHNPARGEATVKRHDGTDAAAQVQRVRVQFTLMPRGQQVALELPLDIREDEGFALVEAVIAAVRQLESDRTRHAASRLLVPR